MAGSESGHLAVVNCIVGLARHSPTWPHPLSDLGFKPYLLGQRFRLRETNEIVSPDAVLVSHDANFVLLAEAKSGTTVDPEQIRRCKALEREDVAQHVTVSNPLQLRHEVMVACFADDLMWVAKNYADAGIEVPIIAIGEESISHSGARFQLEALNQAFAGALEISSEMARPTQYVPFDSNSSPGDVADRILRHIITFMYQRLPRFSTDQLIREFYGDYISLLSDKEEGDVRRLVRNVLSVASKTHLRDYIGMEPGRSSSDWWVIRHSPYEMRPEHRSKSLEAIKRRAARIIADLRMEPWPPEQLQFYWD